MNPLGFPAERGGALKFTCLFRYIAIVSAACCWWPPGPRDSEELAREAPRNSGGIAKETPRRWNNK
eukprot:7845616-Alexandrium_andersonii.AAC.1